MNGFAKTMSEMLSVTEAAKRLGFTTRRIHQLAAEGKLAGAAKVNGEWQIPTESHPYFAKQETNPQCKELQNVTIRKRDEAIRRLGIIWQFEKFAAGNKRIEAIHVFAVQQQISVRTLHRWMAAYKSEGIMGLMDKRGRPNVDETISPEAFEMFKSMYLTQQRLSITTCLRNITFINQDQNKGWKIPSLPAMCRFLEKAIPRFVRILMREGMTAYEAQCAPYIVTDPDSIAPGQIWVGDHAEFNCWIRYRNQWMRPWVTAWMDMRSRVMVGWHLSCSPNQTTILLAAKNAIDKFGLPDSVKIDNGRDYDSEMWTGTTKKQRRTLGRGYLDEQWLAGLWGFMNVAVSFAIPYHPQSKGVLERWFDTVDEQFTKTISTYAGKRAEEKPDDLVERLKDPTVIATAYSFSEFEQLFARYVETYNHSIHTGWGMDDKTPMQVFATRSSRRILQEGVTDLLMRVWSPQLTVGKNGVNFKGLYFGQYDTELLACQGRKVRCSYDPADLRQVYVYDAITLKLITIAEQAQLVRYGAGVDEENLREASAEKRRAVNIAKQFRDKSLTANMDLTDLAIRARESENQAEATISPPISAVAAIRPVVTPLNNQVREHNRQEILKHVRKAAGAESVETVLNFDFSQLKPKEIRADLKLFDER